MAFFGTFRISELVSLSKRVVGGLWLGDVQCSELSVQICIRRSKTDQHRKGVRVELFRGHCIQCCPVAALRQFLVIRPQGHGALFIHLDGSCLSRFQFTAVLRKCLKAERLVLGDYAAHSFRFGVATEAARWGLPTEAITKIGRWESTRYHMYCMFVHICCDLFFHTESTSFLFVCWSLAGYVFVVSSQIPHDVSSG